MLLHVVDYLNFSPPYFIQFWMHTNKTLNAIFFLFWRDSNKSNLSTKKFLKEYFLKNQIYKGSSQITYKFVDKKF